VTLDPIRRVKSPAGKVHELSGRTFWHVTLCRCGSFYEPDHGWEPTSEPLSCGNCLLRIEQAAERAVAS
jgi:hypothetical protein